MEPITAIIRQPIIKISTRMILYGLTTYLGMAAVEAEEAAVQLGTGGGAVIVFLIGALIDKWHNKKDRESQ